ncbi:MAG: hypothetical protein H0T42_23150 [Deltaproteobacteria bacterium]|nr:hypothetical protein [Deltaproteobacteria bacterium]
MSDELDGLKATVMRVLRGELTEESNPAFFEDDVFFIGVRRLEQLDREWLMSNLRDRTYHRDARGLVAIQMTNEGHKELIVELFAERAAN